jgi:hypothetical protein
MLRSVSGHRPDSLIGQKKQHGRALSAAVLVLESAFRNFWDGPGDWLPPPTYPPGTTAQRREYCAEIMPPKYMSVAPPATGRRARIPSGPSPKSSTREFML